MTLLPLIWLVIFQMVHSQTLGVSEYLAIKIILSDKNANESVSEFHCSLYMYLI